MMKEYEKIQQAEQELREMKNRLFTTTISRLYYQGWSYEAISEKTGIPITTLDSWLSEAKKRGDLKPRARHIAKSGQRHNRSKLTDAQVLEIMDMYEQGFSNLEIAERFGISKVYVGQIMSGKARLDNPEINDRRKSIVRKGKGRYYPITTISDIPEPFNAGSIINTLGSPNFDPDTVIEVLHKAAQEMLERGENPGSLIALSNILPEITEEAKKRY